MARCKHFNMLTQMVTELPLLMANGTFKYLDSMQDQELESFLSYLVRYCSKTYSRNPKLKPDWWGTEVKFFDDFYTGATALPFIKHKPMKLRKIIQSCYDHHDARHLLCMSEKLAGRGVYDFEKNPDDTITVYFPNTKTPLAVIPASNVEYDLPRFIGQMNSGLRREVLKEPVKKVSLISYDSRATVTISDSESDSDGMRIEEVSSDDEMAVAPLGRHHDSSSSDDDFSESHQGELGEPKKRLVQGRAVFVDLTVDDDDEEIRAIREAAKAQFLEDFGLMRVGAHPPESLLSLPSKDHKKKQIFSLKKLTLDQVPFLVRIGSLPRRCLTTVDEIKVRTGRIDEYTRPV